MEFGLKSSPFEEVQQEAEPPHGTILGLPGAAGAERQEEQPGPTFVLDFKKPLLPEAAERGDAGAGADEDAGHLGVLGQVETGSPAGGEDAWLKPGTMLPPSPCPRQAEMLPGEAG